MLTSGTLSALQEVLASWIAKDVTKNGHYISSRVPKMAVYGAFISAPLGHFLIHILQKLFSGRTSLKAKILQILVSNLIVSLLFSVYNTDALDPRLTSSLDRANPEFYLPCLHGCHRGRQDLPPDQGYRSSGFYARYEGQLDHLTSGLGIRPEVPAGAHLGAILQHYFICHWNLD